MALNQKIIKTPTMFQMETAECGAAALGMILGYFGCFVTLEELRQECGVSRDGSKASNIIKASEHYGLAAKFGFFDIEELFALDLPAIILWEKKHYLVIEGVKGEWVYVNDPKSGRRKIHIDMFEKGFSQAVIYFEPTDKLQQRKRKATLGKMLFSNLWKSKRPMLFIGLITIMLTIPTVATPVFTQIFIDDYLIQGYVNWLRPLLAIMTGLLIVQFIMVYLQRVLLAKLETKLSIQLNEKLIGHLMRLPLKFFAQRQTGDIIMRLHANTNLAKIVAGPLGITLISLGQAVIYLIILCCYSGLLSFVAVMLTAINIYSYYAVKSWRSQLSLLNRQKNAKLTSITMNGVSRIESIKSMGGENTYFSSWQNNLNNYLNVYQRLLFIDNIVSGIPVVLAIVANALIYGIGGWLVTQGQMSIGGVVAFQSLFLIFNAPVKSFVDLGGKIQKMEADLSRVEDVYRYKEGKGQDKKPSDESGFAKKVFTGKIELVDVTFGYSPTEDPLFNKLNMTINSGDRVAFVGLSGSGKSTLAKIILGLYSPWSGDVMIDGVSLSKIPENVRSTVITGVLQDRFFFQGSIRSNMTLWDPNYIDSDLEAPAIDACIYDLISRERYGFDHNLTDGATNLSGGQSQQLSIARSLLIRPAIMVMDEATSALDSLVEKQIYKNIHAYGMTTINIAHRLSTIRDSDCIYVFDNGSIVEQGSHNELLKDKKSFYSKLYEV